MAVERWIFAAWTMMSAVTFVLFGGDKAKAIRGKWRIPESTLLLCAFLLGAPGGLLGMIIFRHKIRKWKFRIIMSLLSVLQVFLIVSLY